MTGRLWSCKGGEMLEIKRLGDTIKVVDKDLGVDAILSEKGFKGKGSRKYKSEIQDAVSEYMLSQTKEEMDKLVNYEKWIDGEEGVVSFSEYRGASTALQNIWNGTTQAIYDSVSKKTLELWMTNPVKYNPQLRKLSMYWYSLKGIVSRAYELYKNAHSLDSNLKVNNPLGENYDEKLVKINKFDSGINKKTLIRDIIFHTVSEGTCIGYVTGNGGNKFVQLLDLNYYIPKNIVNGYWQVEVDLLKFSTGYNDTYKNYPYDYTPTADEMRAIADLDVQPIDVQNAYRAYVSGKIKRHYLLPMSRTFVIKNMSKQNERLGRPIGTPVFADLLHKELIRNAEVALIDRLINMILVIKMGETGKDGFHPKKEHRREMAIEVKKALTEGNISGLKLVGIPYWAEIEALKTDLTLFDKQKYESIDNDIAVGLGVNGLLDSSDNASYANGQLTLSLFMNNIYSILEQIEENLFNYQYNLLVPESTVVFKREFNRTMVLDNKSKIEILRNILDKGGSVKYVLDTIGVNFEDYINAVKYEKETVGINEIFVPFVTSYTQTGVDNDDVGRPRTNDDEDNGNNNPKPSTE